MAGVISVAKRLEKIREDFRKNGKVVPKNDCSEDMIHYIFKRRNLKSYKIVIKNRSFDNLSDLYVVCMKLFELGPKIIEERYILMYGEDLYKEIWKEISSKKRVTLEIMTKKYGEDEGRAKWDSYRQKQAYTNTLQYKLENNILASEEEFIEYNKSRATTLEKMIQRYGEDEGRAKWDSYRQKQAYTNTEAHLGERYAEVNKKKGLTLDNFIRKYGHIEGPKRFKNYYENCKSPYSKTSQKLFFAISELEPFKSCKKIYFAEHNKEYGLLDPVTKRYKKYDFVAPELQLVIEYHGDHYHGNPKYYTPSEFLKGRGMGKITAKEIWNADEYKQLLIKNARGYETIVVWEDDWLVNPKDVINRILEYARSRIPR